MKTQPLNRPTALASLAAGTIAIASLLLGGVALGSGGLVGLASLPAAVREAADKVAPGVRWSSAYQDTADGQVIYELEGEDARQRVVTIAITAAGKVTLVENEIALAEAPTAVRAAAVGKIPSFQATAVFAIRRGTDLVRSEPTQRAFALDGTGDNNREVSVKITPEGKITLLERQIALTAVPPTVIKALLHKVPQFRAVSAHEIHNDGSLTGYVLEGSRATNGKANAKQAEAEISVFVSADGKEVEVDEG